MTTPQPSGHGPGAEPPPGCPAHRSAPYATADPALTQASALPAIHGPEFAADPDSAYAALRARGPAHWVELAPGVEAILVTDYDAALEVLRSPYFSKDARRWTAMAQQRVPVDNQVVPMMGWRPSLLFADGERHLRLRTSVDDSLARVNPHRLRAYVQRSATQLIDAFGPDGRADLVGQYADRLPALVFTQLFGCPGELAARMAVACGQMIDAEPATAQQGSEDLARCLGELVAAKRRNPGADVTSWLLNHHAALSDEEMVHQLVVLIGAGTVPQAAWISTAVMLLLTDDRFGHDLSGGNMTVTDALNEVLWTRSPMSNFCFHYATAAYVLRDGRGREFPVPTGVPVLVSHAAANTDPALGGGHGRLASNHSHLAFSAGPHLCPAQDIAGVIADVAIETLLDQLPDMETAVPAGQLAWRPGPFHRSLTSLPVHFPAMPRPGTAESRVSPALPPEAVPSDATTGAQTWTAKPAAPSSIPQAPPSTTRRPASAPAARRRGWPFRAASKRGR